MAKRKIPRVVVIVDNGRVDEVLSDVAIDAEIVELDLDGVEEDSLIAINGDDEVSFYTRFPAPTKDVKRVDEIFSRIKMARKSK